MVTNDGLAAELLKPTFQLLAESSPLTNEKNFMLFHVSRLRQLDELWYRLSINRHEVAVGVVLEQLGSSFQDVLVMLDQPFRTRVRLAHFALAIATEEPVLAQRVCVLLLGDPDALGRLSLEPLQLSRPDSQMCADLKIWHTSSFGAAIQRQQWIAGITSLLLGVAGNPEGSAESSPIRHRFAEWRERYCICRAGADSV
jgi:hypothetical protein